METVPSAREGTAMAAASTNANTNAIHFFIFFFLLDLGYTYQTKPK